VGVAAATVTVTWILGAFAGLVIPLVIAAILGVLLQPIVNWLERARCPRALAAGLVLLGLLVVVAASVWITIVGVLDQRNEISRQVTSGLDFLNRKFGAQWASIGDPGSGTDGLAGLLPQLFGGFSSWFGSLFSGLAAFVIGTGIALFFLFYVLRDWQQLTGWLEHHLGVDPILGRDFVDSSIGSIRAYFNAITVSSVVTAVVIGLAALALGLPLAFTIALVTFVTSYIPYIGALFSGTFAVLIALGAAGVVEAMEMLVVILVAQNIIQTLLITKMSSKSLSIHPIANLGSTIIGGVVAGLLGAMLSAPVVAIIIMVRRGLARQRASQESQAAVQLEVKPVKSQGRTSD